MHKFTRLCDGGETVLLLSHNLSAFIKMNRNEFGFSTGSKSLIFQKTWVPVGWEHQGEEVVLSEDVLLLSGNPETRW